MIFKNFNGNTSLEKISNALDEIVKNGKILNKNGCNYCMAQKR